MIGLSILTIFSVATLFLAVKNIIDDEIGWGLIFTACFAFVTTILGMICVGQKEQTEVVYKDSSGRKYILEQKVDTIYILKDTCLHSRK